MTPLEILQKETENAIAKRQEAEVKLFKLEQENYSNKANYEDSLKLLKKIKVDLKQKSIDEISNMIDLFLGNEEKL